jgi:hypothetical protein
MKGSLLNTLLLTWPAMHWMKSIRHIVIHKKNSFVRLKICKAIKSRRVILDQIWAAWKGSKRSVLVQVIKIYREVEVQLHMFLTLELDGSEWWTVLSGRLKAAPVSLNNKLSGRPRDGLRGFGGNKNVLFLDGVEPRTFLPASKSLYRLSYIGYDRQEP